MRRSGTLLGVGALASLAPAQRSQNRPAAAKADECNCGLGTDGSPLDTGTSELRPVIERYEVELRNLNRVYAILGSAVRQGKMEKFYADQLQLLEKINFDALSQEGKVDYLLLRERLRREERQLANENKQDSEVAALIPFQQTIIGFEEARRRMETVDPQKCAGELVRLTTDVTNAKSGVASLKAPPAVMNRAAIRLEQLRGTMRSWYNFYALYDPKFAWWVDAEY